MNIFPKKKIKIKKIKIKIKTPTTTPYLSGPGGTTS
jgi:hypothetical protein